jgi:hypothetical protein
MNEVTFTVPGYCQPKQRTLGRGFITPPETRAYEKIVRQYAKLAMRSTPPLVGFIGLTIRSFKCHHHHGRSGSRILLLPASFSRLLAI